MPKEAAGALDPFAFPAAWPSVVILKEELGSEVLRAPDRAPTAVELDPLSASTTLLTCVLILLWMLATLLSES